MLERLRACGTCARFSITAALAGAFVLQRSARALESGCQLCCTCTLAMIAVDHFSAAVESHRDPSMYMAYGPRGRFENQAVPENLTWS